MSVFTGPLTSIYADTTIPGTSAVAMTAFRAKGNSVRLRIKTTTGGCGSLTFTAEESEDGTTYYSVIDRDTAWSFVTTVPTTAGTYAFDLEGLDCTPNMYYRLSYQAATAAGKLQVDMLNWENPKGGGISVSVPDVVVDVDNIDVNIEGVEQAHSDAVGAMGFMQVVEAKDFDGSAFPNDVSEGDVVRPAASMYGVTYSAIVSESGAETPLVAHDAAIAAATGGSSGFMIMGETKTVDSAALPNSASAEGDAVRPAYSLGGAALSVPVTQSGLATAIIAIDEAPATGVGGAVVMGGYTAKDFDGSAVPAAAGTEGDAAAAAVSLSGVMYATITNEALTTTPLIAHDEAVANGVGGTTVATSCNSQAFDGSAIAAVGTELDAVKPSASLYGVSYTMPVTQDGASTPLVAHDAAIGSATGGNVGFAVVAETKTVDGAALPNTCGAEGDAVRVAASLAGVVYNHPTTASGTDGAVSLHDTAIASGVGTAAMMTGLESADIDGSAIPNAVDAEGDIVRAKGTLSGVALVAVVSEAGEYIQPTGDATARPVFAKLTDATTDSDVLPLTAAVKPTGALGVAGEIADFDSGVGEDFTAAIGILGAKIGGPVPIPAGDAVANSIFVAVGDNTTTATVTTGTIKALNAAISDGETLADVIVTSSAAAPTSIIGVGGEVVDFDTAGTDLTAAIGILGASATGAHPVITDNDGHLQIDVLSSPLDGAIYADDDDWTDSTSKHALVGGLYQSVPQSITDGDVGPLQVDVHGNAKVVITDGTDTASVVQLADALNVHNQYAIPVAAVVSGRGSASAISEVKASAFAGDADNFDGNTGLNTVAMLCGRIDDNTVKNVHITAGYALTTDTTSVGGTAYALGTAAMAASQPVTIATDDTMFTALDAAVDSIDGKITACDTSGLALESGGNLDTIAGDTTSIDGKVPALGTALMAASMPVTIATNDTMFTALDTAVDLIADASYADDADWTDSTSKHILTGGLYQSVPQSITDGDVGPFQVDSKGNIKSVITDGTNVAAVGTGTTKTLSVGIHDGEKLAGVTTCTAMADDLDGLNGLITASVLHGYVDDNTTHTVLVNSSGHVYVINPNKYAYTTDTGAGAMNKSIAISAPAELVCVECKFSAAPTTGTQALTVTKDNVTGANYDVVHLSEDMVAAASTSFAWRPNPPVPFYTGDAIVVAFTNTDAVTYGLTVTTRLV